MRPQRYDEVVNAVGGVVGRQDDGLVLPLVVPGVPVAAVFADLSQLEAAQRLLLLEEVAQGGTDANVGRHGREAFHYANGEIRIM